MIVLVINSGSSSIKFRVFSGDDTGELELLIQGLVKEPCKLSGTIKINKDDISFEETLKSVGYRAALEKIFAVICHPVHGVIKDLSQINVVGHRTVHGGDTFTGAVLIDQDVIRKMEDCIHLAPLHNPANLEGIRQAMELLPDIPQVAVFDTAFHQTVPLHAALYPLPYQYFETHKIRKYGFHGTSVQYACLQIAKMKGIKNERSKLVVCHLGNGVSVTAVKDNMSVDTSLGFTSVAGAMMGTRCGDLDPGVMLYMQRELNLSLAEVDHILHKQSGLLGVSGISNDMQVVIELAEEGDERCLLALEMFAYRIRKYIGAYAAVMGGIDGLVFTGGIGENSAVVRKLITEQLNFIGLKLDPVLNLLNNNEDRVISSSDSKAAIVVISANEEKMIAAEAIKLLNIAVL